VCLAASISLHVAVIAWFASVPLHGASEGQKVLRVSILAKAGDGLPEGGAPAGPPRPAQEVPIQPQPAPAPRKLRKSCGDQIVSRPKAARAAEQPAPAAPSEATSGVVVEGGAAAAGDEASGAPGGGGGTGNGRGAGTGDGTGTGGSLLGAYLARIRQRIENAKRYPLLARRSHVEGRATVVLELNQSGEALSLELESADHPLLGEAALLAVRAASPFERLPDGIDVSVVRVEVPLRFSLREP